MTEYPPSPQFDAALRRERRRTAAMVLAVLACAFNGVVSLVLLSVLLDAAENQAARERWDLLVLMPLTALLAGVVLLLLLPLSVVAAVFAARAGRKRMLAAVVGTFVMVFAALTGTSVLVVLAF